LRSYGRHFPLVNAIRDSRTGKPRLWLLNGDTWGGSGGWGVSTSTQQTQVRRHAEATGLPVLIIPVSAWLAAGIEMDSIRPLAVDADTWGTETVTFPGEPEDAKWVPTHDLIEGTGYYWNGGAGGGYDSFDAIPEDIRAYFDAEGRVLPQYRVQTQTRVSFGRTHTDWNAPHPAHDYATRDIMPPESWAYGRKHYTVPPVYRHTGSKLTGPHGDYAPTPEGGWTQQRRTHQLGQAVFRAAYRAGGKRYFANFLSGVDNTPHGSGYFLVQLPKGADVSTVASAIDSLKPDTVRAAESTGLDVARQGDLYAIPTGYDIRQLRAMGADIRQSSKASEGQRAALRERWEARYESKLTEQGIPLGRWETITPEQSAYRDALRQRYSTAARAELIEWDASHQIHTERDVYGTRHEGTEVAILPNGVTLARGTLRHTGGQHRMLSLGKRWHLIVRNTVPLARPTV
jgi:hypothetical protein